MVIWRGGVCRAAARVHGRGRGCGARPARGDRGREGSGRGDAVSLQRVVAAHLREVQLAQRTPAGLAGRHLSPEPLIKPEPTAAQVDRARVQPPAGPSQSAPARSAHRIFQRGISRTAPSYTAAAVASPADDGGGMLKVRVADVLQPAAAQAAPKSGTRRNIRKRKPARQRRRLHAQGRAKLGRAVPS